MALLVLLQPASIPLITARPALALQGYGKFLISFSYELSKIEGKASPGQGCVSVAVRRLPLH